MAYSGLVGQLGQESAKSRAAALANTNLTSACEPLNKDNLHNILDDIEMNLTEILGRSESLADFVSGPTPKDTQCGTVPVDNSILQRASRIRTQTFRLREELTRLENSI